VMTNKIPPTISEKLIALNARLSMDDIDVIYEAVERIEQLEAALEYYAKNHYPNVDDGPWGINSNDWGDVARAALEGKKDV
jgi:hypothetical protein